MKDPRYTKMAQNLINYSIELQPSEKVWISSSDGEVELTREIIRAVHEAGGIPFLKLNHTQLQTALDQQITQEQLELMAEVDIATMKKMDAYLSVGKTLNTAEFSSVPQDKSKLRMEHYLKPLHYDVRATHTKWCVFRMPNEAMAQDAGMSTEDFEDFYFDVCTLDYAKMSKAMDPLAELMNRTDKVRIVGPGTDLTFSIKGIGSVKCSGKRNIPDGEVYTAPVRDSINGVLQYNAPSRYSNFTFDNIRLTFRDGKIVEATANDSERLNEVLDTDEGARYIGEFAIAFNPYILEPMNDILFDEKIAGSFHFTPGQAYATADNGNKSAIHWDIVCIQRPEYGGGEIWFDDVLIRKDGRFILPELQGLNPENLK